MPPKASSSYTWRQPENVRPSMSAELHPKIESAWPDQRTTRRSVSHSITASGVLSKCADMMVCARRSFSSTTFCSWMSLVVA
jgi:hypothetical protein